MKSFKRGRGPVGIASAAVLATLLTGCGSDSGEYNWQFASYGPPSFAPSKAMEIWAEELGKATDGAVSVDFFFAESLLTGAEILPGVADGRADIGYIAAQYYPAELPLSQVTGIPFVTQTPEAQALAIQDLYENNDAFRDEFHRNGVHLISVSPLNSMIIAANEPIDELEDLDGAKVRVTGYAADAFAELGAEPIALSQPESYESLERGVLDMISGIPLDIAQDFNYQEILDYYVDPGVGLYALTAHVMNLDVWESLPQDIKDAVESTTEQQSEVLMQMVNDKSVEACDVAIDAGVKVSTLPAEESERWKSEVQDQIVEKWMKEAKAATDADVEAFWDDYTAAIEKYEDPSAVPATVACAEKSS